jgi:hypothetical protein
LLKIYQSYKLEEIRKKRDNQFDWFIK